MFKVLENEQIHNLIYRPDLVIWCREGASCGITLLSHPKVNLGIITTTTQLKQLIPKSVIFGDALFVIIKNNPEIPPDKSFEDFIYSTSDMITSRNSKLLALLVFPPGEFEKFLKCRLTKQCDQLNHSD